ncbi:MAG TPA: phosphonopyruvate decarboxylase [Acidimicrobiia bacterium]|nr:phosphonopyruvate decarboxylase [Acidimicrobiia bacterium]
MPTAQQAFEAFTEAGIEFWTGVPDSLLKPLCAYVADHVDADHHVIAANEGGAVAIAAGHYLATGRPGAVYLQNSGLGNTINPLVSLADPDVYGIPMLLVIGWRGEPNRPDEPQHIKQGRATLPLLDAIGVPHAICTEDAVEFATVVAEAGARAITEERPVALIVPKGIITDYTGKKSIHDEHLMTREMAIAAIADGAPEDAVIVATTGKTSRELFEYRAANHQAPVRDFLMVGSMGHASQTALGMALGDPAREVWVLDGDGALVMHMGGMCVITDHQPRNLRHIVLNNRVHDSVGGQPTPTSRVSLTELAKATGYASARSASTPEALGDAIAAMGSQPGPSLLEVLVAPGARTDLGRPTSTPRENKAAMMGWLRE